MAAIAGVRNHVAYEGQAAVELEAMAEDEMKRAYPFEISDVDGVKQFLIGPILKAVVQDLHDGCSAGLISATFHNTLVALFQDMCERIRASRGLKQVVLSGGCFQNVRLLVHLTEVLEEKGFKVFSQSQVPCNDGGIALGQALIADAMYKAGPKK